MKNTQNQFTAVYKKHGAWYLGWVEELPGVNTQGKTLRETKSNLKDALNLVLSANRDIARKEFEKELSLEILREKILVPVS